MSEHESQLRDRIEHVGEGWEHTAADIAAIRWVLTELAAVRGELAECQRERDAAESARGELQKRLAEWQANLARWGQSITVRNFLRDYANECFQMQGMYDGAMSEECKARFKQNREFTLELIAAIHGEGVQGK